MRVNSLQTFKVVLTVSLVTCALVVTALVVRREILLNQTTDVKPDQVLSDSMWQVISATHQGFESSFVRPVTIVEYFDYGCSFCRELQPALNALEKRYAEEVTVIYRHYPIFRHPAAYDAAIAAECAANQGYFKAFHNTLFLNQELLPDTVNWDLMAQLVRLPDLERFRNCVSALDTAPKVDADTSMAKMFHIDGVPTLIVNGKVYSGLLTADELDHVVQRALVEAD